MRIIDSKTKFPVEISKRHVLKALEQTGQNDPSHCVVAEALKEGLRKQGTPALAVQVGPRRTVLVFPGKQIRYATAGALRNALIHWDTTGEWKLPEGTYNLNPVAKSHTKKYVKARAARRKRNGEDSRVNHARLGTESMVKAPAFCTRAIAFPKDAKTLLKKFFDVDIERQA